MNETAYWIWLLRTLGSAAPLADILSVFGSPQKLYEAGSTQWRLSGILTPKQIYALTQYSPSESGEVMNACRGNGWQILTPEHICYPQSLLELRNFPPVLFVWGNAEVLCEEVKISLVGTRKASPYGQRVATLLAQALAQSGVTIVSGGALGIDSAAHTGALQAHGKTIAVLGCGLGTPYLEENAPMRAQIANSGGAVLSEFLPFSHASRTTFPLRNRIISALSLGTVVVEAGERSGSLITARCALEQGRDVFAVPGDLISTAYTGGNRLIRDGAKPVFAPMDVLEEYLYVYPTKLNASPSEKSFRTLLSEAGAQGQRLEPIPEARTGHRSKKAPAPQPAAAVQPAKAKPSVPQKQSVPLTLPQGLSKEASAVYRALDGPMHIDDLCEKVQLPVSRALAALTELELFGLAALAQGKTYSRTETV